MVLKDPDHFWKVVKQTNGLARQGLSQSPSLESDKLCFVIRSFFLQAEISSLASVSLTKKNQKWICVGVF